MKYSLFLLNNTAALAICSTMSMLTAAPALGQAVAASQDEPFEIVVTANKRNENANKIGVTLTTLSADVLTERGVTSLESLASVVPGLAYAASTTNTPVFTLRGVGFNESSLGVYPAVSVYLDQIPLPFPVLASHAAYDLERVEVLKGPQGTLFGQNSTGGAVNYIAAKPTKSLEVGGNIGFGRFNEISGNAYISGPLGDNLSARVAVTGLQADAWQYSQSRPDDRNGKQSYVAGRLILDWSPADTVRLSFNANGWIDKSEPQAQQLIAVRPGVRPATAVVLQGLATVPFSPENNRAADWSTGRFEPRSERKFYQVALRGDVDVTDAIALTSLTSYAHFTQDQATDGDGTYLVTQDLDTADGRISTFGQEVRLATTGNPSLRWVLGANLEKSKTFEDQVLRYIDQTNNNPNNLNINSSGDRNRQDITSYAFFANIEKNILPGVVIKGAARYTETKINNNNCGYSSGDGRVGDLFNILGNILGTVPFTPIGLDGCYTLNYNNVPGEAFVDTLKEDNISWKAGVDYQVNPQTLLYVNVSRGYKAGSYPSLAAASFVQIQPVTQESVTAFEGGIKATLFDRMLQLNAAGFYYDYRDKQIRGKKLDPIFSLLDTLVNIPRSRILGAELDATFRPMSTLTIGASLTYLDSKIQGYSGFNLIGEQFDFSGVRLPYTSNWNYSFNVDYKPDLGGRGAPFIGASVMGRSSSDAAPGGSTILFPATDPLVRLAPYVTYVYRMPGYATVDLRAGYEAEDDRWKVMFWAKNVFNKYYVTNVIPSLDTAGRLVGRPATYGVTLSFKTR